MSEPVAGIAPAVQTAWRRTSPRMLLVHSIRALGQFLPVILVAVIFGRRDEGDQIPFVVASVAAPLVLGLVTWLTTRYRVGADRLEVRSGWFVRSVKAAPLDRLRSVDVTATVLHRVLGMAAVRIGTAADEPVEIDGLSAADARELGRAVLAARSGGDVADDEVGGAREGSGRGVPLAVFSPSWLRFAPLTVLGLVVLGSLAGFLAQFAWDAVWDGLRGAAAAVGARHPSWALMGAIAVLVVAVAQAVLAVGVYALRYGGYRLERDPRGDLHLQRGLLTRHATTWEAARLRGVVVSRPLLLRPLRGAHADVLASGGVLDQEGAGSTMLVPPAPLRTVLDVAGEVAHDEAAVCGVVRGHGRAATRRRYTRAVSWSVLLWGAVAVAGWQRGWWEGMWVVLGATAAGLLSVPLAYGRSRTLGHLLTSRHLVVSSGLFPQQRAAVRWSGVLGWAWQSTPFQRRLSLVTLQAFHSAPGGQVTALDVPEGVAVGIVAGADLDLIRPFLATPCGVGAAATDADGPPRSAGRRTSVSARVSAPDRRTPSGRSSRA